MSWVRLDDSAPGHRKIVGLSDAAFRLWIVGLTYCSQQANDGLFSAASARIMTGYLASPECGRSAIAELCAAGLWAETSDGYQIHDYLDYQPSHTDRAAANKAAAERMRKMRAGKSDVREMLQRNNARTSREVRSSPPVPSPPDPRSDLNPEIWDQILVRSEQAEHPQQAAEHTTQATKAKRGEGNIALELFADLNAARMRAIPGAEQLEPRKAALESLTACLRQGYTPDEIRRVFELKVLECKADPSQARWFTPGWFSPSNVDRYLALQPEHVAGGPAGRQGKKARPQQIDSTLLALQNRRRELEALVELDEQTITVRSDDEPT